MQKQIQPKTCISLPISIQKVVKNTNEVEKRKSDLPEYRELFSCLFKIKDQDVQQRVMNAINARTSTSPETTKNGCRFCKLSISAARAERKPQTTTICTQTLDRDFDYLRTVNGESVAKKDGDAKNENGKNGLNTNNTTASPKPAATRQRKNIAPYARKIDLKATQQSLAETRKRLEFKEVSCYDLFRNFLIF